MQRARESERGCSIACSFDLCVFLVASPRSRIFVTVYERSSCVWSVKTEFEVQAQNDTLLAIVREKVSESARVRALADKPQPIRNC